MSPRILVVDDSPFVCEALGAALRDAGFEVEVAYDLWDFERDIQPRPDLVLMDVVLQEAFGDDVAAMLRTTRGFTCPIYLVSSLDDDELSQRAADAGLDGFISKRLGLGGVVGRVTALLGTRAPATAPDQPARRFRVDAHQRVRRVLHIASRPQRWNAASIIAEMNALAGDADLIGKPVLAEAARRCRGVVERQGSAGPTDAVRASIEEVVAAVDAAAGTRPRTADIQKKLLIIDDSGFHRGALLEGLDAAGHVVVEARTLAEARQKLRAVDYDLVLLEPELEGGAGRSLIPEIRTQTPGAAIGLLGTDLGKQLEADQQLARIERLLRAS